MDENSKEEFFGKVILITGASSGIGAATAIHFAKLGASLSLIGRNLENLEKTREKCLEENHNIPLLLITADLTIEEEIKNLVDKTIQHFGKLDILINNAGIYELDTIQNANLETFDKIFNTNVRSIYILTHISIPHLITSKGNIVNISSLTGLRPFPWCLSYTMSKAALDQFTRCVALELAPKQVRVNSVNPGSVLTDAKLAMTEEKLEEFYEKCKEVHPLGRAAQMEEVARAVAFLASEKASFITGVTVPVDGGRHAACPR